MIRLICSLVLVPIAGVLVLGGSSSVARADDVKIAVVDTQKIISDSIIGKAAKHNLEAQIKKGQTKLAAMKADFEKQKEEFAKQAPVLSQSARESRQEELQKKQMEFQKTYQEMQEGLAKTNEAELSKVVKQVTEVVDDLADERGYTFVFERDRQVVLFGSERIDITEEVQKILDKKKVAL